MQIVTKLLLLILFFNLNFNYLQTSAEICCNQSTKIATGKESYNIDVNRQESMRDKKKLVSSAAAYNKYNENYDNIKLNLITELPLGRNNSDLTTSYSKSNKYDISRHREQMSNYWTYNPVNLSLPTKTHINYEELEPVSRRYKINTKGSAFNLTSKSIRQLTSNLKNNSIYSLQSKDVDQYFLKYINYNKDSCLLDNVKQAFMWWSLPNGSLTSINNNGPTQNAFLDLSSLNLTKETDLLAKVWLHTRFKEKKIIAFSAANNRLNKVPYRTLTFMKFTLKYLTLKGNIFFAHNINENVKIIINSTLMTQVQPNFINNKTKEDMNFILNNEREGIAWATFPPLIELIELDISNCSIEYVSKAAFKNLNNLRRLFLSHNKLLKIPADTFYYVQGINYLDLSFMNEADYHIPYPTLDAVFNMIYGVKIPQTTFKNLSRLEYLDLSHTKLTRNSAMAFTQLSEHLKYLSLCYTGFPMISNAIFKNTALIALDLSGNPYASHHIIDDTFEGVSETLKYLFFEQSNIKDLDWLKSLWNLRVLGLTGNNINSISLETFSNLQQLQILDLSSNHLGNWYKQIFTNNRHLHILNLRNNNINIITKEMLKDFQNLEYLGISDNDFVCDCLLYDLVDMAVSNSKNAMCVYDVLRDAHDNIVRKMFPLNSFLYSSIMNENLTDHLGLNVIAQTIIDRYFRTVWNSNRNIKYYNLIHNRYRVRFLGNLFKSIKEDVESAHCNATSREARTYQNFNGSQLNFQLLDYSDDHYWCFNETEQLQFVQLNCQMRNSIGDFEQELHTLTRFILAGVGSLIGVMLLIVFIYLKRWHIHYYYSSLKSAALMSLATKDKINKFKQLSETDPNLIYDIFISYCQNDREWVLEELLPNVEEARDISICMHERDFQIGVTILDNIISCMDRSKALMLIISTNFLLSHWCQFEMHLAQHRMFEASKEHLILVFLEDIPRSKRPKTLQYLMDVKTYIKWPSGCVGRHMKSDDKKLFWKRMRKSLEAIGLRSIESSV